MENITAAQKIFFSYSRSDGQECTFKLANDLRAAGANVWVDQQDIDPGKNWDIEIENALNAADCVLFVATQKSVQSNNVQNELGYALEENKKVIPVVFHQCKIPFRLSRLQRIDFTTDYNVGFERLMKALGLKSAEAAASSKEQIETPKEILLPPVEKKEELQKPEPVTTTVMKEEHELPKEKKLSKSSLMERSGVIANEDPEHYANIIKEDRGLKKVLYWGLGALAVAALVFFLVRGTSGSAKDNPKAETDTQKMVPADTSTMILSKTTSPADTNKARQPLVENKPVANPYEEKKTISENNPPVDNEKLFAGYKQKGLDLFEGKDYGGAIEQLEKALAIKPDAVAYFHAGRSCAQLNEYAKAIENFSSAIKLAPDKPAYLMYRGIAYRNNGQYAKSIADLDNAVSLAPNDGQLYYNRGLSKQANSDASGACTDFQSSANHGFAQGQTAYNANCGGAKVGAGTKVFRTDKIKVQPLRRTQAPNVKY